MSMMNQPRMNTDQHRSDKRTLAIRVHLWFPSVHAACATGPICRYVWIGALAGLYSPRRLYQSAVTQHAVPGATSLANCTSNVVRPVCPSSFQPGSFAGGGVRPAKLMIVAPSALGGRRIVLGNAASSI